MQDPFFAVKEEVEHSVTVVTQLHTKWEELRDTKHGGDEFEWTTSELLSGLRSIEWDLQDLEDTVSIVKGNRVKFQLDDADVQAREDFIELTRQRITAMRDEVQGASGQDAAGFSTKGTLGLPSIGKSKGYARAGGEESVPLGRGDVEMNGRSGREQPMASALSGNDEILGADLSMGPITSQHRHVRKKVCLGLTVLLLLIAGGAAAKMMAGGGSAEGERRRVQLQTVVGGAGVGGAGIGGAGVGGAGVGGAGIGGAGVGGLDR